MPVENMAQIQCGLLVSGREWCDYVSYCAGMPLYIKRVHPSVQWADAIVESAMFAEIEMKKARTKYEAAVADMPVMPESTFDKELTF